MWDPKRVRAEAEKDAQRARRVQPCACRRAACEGVDVGRSVGNRCSGPVKGWTEKGGRLAAVRKWWLDAWICIFAGTGADEQLAQDCAVNRAPAAKEHWQKEHLIAVDIPINGFAHGALRSPPPHRAPPSPRA